MTSKHRTQESHTELPSLKARTQVTHDFPQTGRCRSNYLLDSQMVLQMKAGNTKEASDFGLVLPFLPTNSQL